MTNEWPKHPDGRPMKMGEMTREQQDEQFRKAVLRIKEEFETPVVQAKLAAILRGERIDN